MCTSGSERVKRGALLLLLALRQHVRLTNQIRAAAGRPAVDGRLSSSFYLLDRRLFFFLARRVMVVVLITIETREKTAWATRWLLNATDLYQCQGFCSRSRGNEAIFFCCLSVHSSPTHSTFLLDDNLISWQILVGPAHLIVFVFIIKLTSMCGDSVPNSDDNYYLLDNDQETSLVQQAIHYSNVVRWLRCHRDPRGIIAQKFYHPMNIWKGKSKTRPCPPPHFHLLKFDAGKKKDASHTRCSVSLDCFYIFTWNWKPSSTDGR